MSFKVQAKTFVRPSKRLLTPSWLLIFSLFLTSELQAAAPNWNGCHVNDFQNEFFGKAPFGKPLVGWSDDDFNELRRRVFVCNEPGARARSDTRLAIIDSRIADYKRYRLQAFNMLHQKDREAAFQIERQRQAGERVRQDEANAERVRQLSLQWLAEVTRLDGEIAKLKVDADPRTNAKLDEIRNALAQVGNFNSLDREIQFIGTPERQAFSKAKEELLERIRIKREANVKAGYAVSRLAFKTRAKAAADIRSADIERLGIPADYLSAPIIIQTLTEKAAFLSLRETIGLLFERRVGVISAVKYESDNDIGLSIKTPGSQSKIYGFRLDGGELFLSRYEQDGSQEFLNDIRERSLVAHQLRESLGWRQEWNTTAP